MLLPKNLQDLIRINGHLLFWNGRIFYQIQPQFNMKNASCGLKILQRISY